MPPLFDCGEAECPVELIEAVTGNTYTRPLPPGVIAGTPEVQEAETNNTFGSDFPSLFSTPPMTEQGMVTGAVTSGGDSALYGWSGNEDEDDDNGN